MATSINLSRLIHYRYERLQAQIRVNNCTGALLANPLNVRYATDTHYAQLTNMHSPFRFVFVPAEGKAVLYDSATIESGLLSPVIGERREAIVSAHFIAGGAHQLRSKQWIDEITELVRELDTGTCKLAIDSAEPEFVSALLDRRIRVVDADPLVERAGAIKSCDELDCIRGSISVAERALQRIQDSLRPGLTERELWAALVHENACHGGQWCDYAVLSSGWRTNPWGRECSDKIIAEGELVGVDTGMIGPTGYSADISRTFHVGPSRPSSEQRELYQTAMENLRFNVAGLRAGLSFRNFAENAWVVPTQFWARRYNSVAHGVGMGNEWPHIPFAADWQFADPRDALLEENMVLAVESCIGRETGGEFVKLEEMVVITTDGAELLSSYPFEQTLM